MSQATGISERTALRFVVLVGLVSLFADMTYEGARSITGPYLAVLGASGTAVGVIAGLGELLGYGLRLASGYLADRTKHYWALTLLGYGVNVLAVPLLALAGRWEIAAALMIAERVGKAIRTPARDVMLSQATHRIGHGRGFGLHEALDQVGAVSGPLLVALVLGTGRAGYPTAFAALWVPALLTLGVLTVAWRLFPDPRQLEAAPTDRPGPDRLPAVFWLYLAASALIAAGFADFPLIAYHLGKHAVVPPVGIPILYAFAMGVDAVAALLFGRWFDRLGLGVLIASTLLSALFAPLVFLGRGPAALMGVILWGIGLGAQESILRATIAGMVPPERRGWAYGLFNAAFGIAWFLGSALMGFLYDAAPYELIAFSVVAQLAALPLLGIVARGGRGAAGASPP
ncbi:MAG TPA: MFS transporter [Isosphaeraceae bacterium]|nr:MFS transporter [Isosphaeraceae bacterium]